MSDTLDVRTVRDAMDDRMEEWVGILSDFIGIPSENPPGDTREIATYLTELLDDRGIRYDVIAPKETMPNVVAHVEGDIGDPEDGPHLVYNGHLDTLHVGDESKWDRDPFSGEVADGRVFGRGATDMYGGMVASLASFLYLSEHTDAFEGKVTFTAVSDEETGGEWGAQYLVENHPEVLGDVLLNGEPSGTPIVRFGERGALWLEVTVDGDPAASAYGEGVNAIETLMKILFEIKTLPERREFVNVPEDLAEVIRRATPEYDAVWGEGASAQAMSIDVSVGVIEGGKRGAVNVTPEHAVGQVDIRLPIGTTNDEVLSYVRELASVYPGDVDVSVIHGTDFTYSDVDHPIFQYLTECGGIVRDRAPVVSCALAGTDCRFWRQAGVPSAVYGPTPHNVGGANEYVEIEDFDAVVKTQAMASAKFIAERGE